MRRLGKTLIRRVDRRVRVPWFVLAWLALACHIALRSLAAIGSTAAATAAPQALGLVARLAVWIEWPLPVAILIAAVWAFRRNFQAAQGASADATSTSPERPPVEVPAAGGPSFFGPGLAIAPAVRDGASGPVPAVAQDFNPRETGTSPTERQAPGGPVG